MSGKLKIAILGRKKDTANYENFLSENGFEPVTTLSPGTLFSCGGLLLPGGGDIAPVFFGEQNNGSRGIDVELDILQFEALELGLRHSLPILGVCKGMQLINVAFGGTVVQDMADSALHRSPEGDVYHATLIEKGSALHALCGETAIVNSAHHQCTGRIGRGLRVIQRSVPDNCPEALTHRTLPILGVQWHPERLAPARTELAGASVLSVFHDQRSSMLM